MKTHQHVFIFSLKNNNETLQNESNTIVKPIKIK
jgi:hypothetical protein